MPYEFRSSFILLACAWIGGCGSESETETADPPLRVTPPPAGTIYERLSDYHFFADPALQTPATDLIPYDVNAPLFSDYTTKFRFLYAPEGSIVEVSGDELELPVGAILVKTFTVAPDVREPYEDLRLVETRVLIREAEGYVQHTYVWNEEGTDAERLVAGKFIPVEFIGPSGDVIQSDYRVPNTNECKNCHKSDDAVVPLGVRLRQLDRPSADGAPQLKSWVDAGFLSEVPHAETPLVNPYDPELPISMRARSYFDSNCASCHRQEGEAGSSGLFLNFEATDPDDPDTDPGSFGVCKNPTSTGQGDCDLTFDVVPGAPEESILICRMSSTDLEKRMPPLGSKVVHEEGLALMTEWILSLPPAECSP